MARITTFATGLVTAASIAIPAIVAAPVATANPATALDSNQLPGLGAVQNLSPVITRAAADPTSAQHLLLAAASQLAGNTAASESSVQLANSVMQFLRGDGINSTPEGVTPHITEGTAAEPLGIPNPAVSGIEHGTMPLLTPGTGNSPRPPATPPTAKPTPNTLKNTPEQHPTRIAPAQPNPAPNPVAQPSPSSLQTSESPTTQDFMYPTISNECLADGGTAIATALSVAGPAAIPTPGPTTGQTAYVFTAIGTPAPAAEQKKPLILTWINLTTGTSGSTTLHTHPDINPQGPTTLTAIADTGSGNIMSTIFGDISTVDHQCTFLPTIGSTIVP